MELDIQEVQEAPKTELAPIERAALALESTKTEQHLLALATKHQSITVVKDKAGREQAHGAYIEVMRARTAVEKAAKEAREDATKFSKAVIAEAARLVAIVEPEEARLKEARDVWDEEQARIKAEEEARERARILAITERIAAIKNYVVLASNCRTSERIQELQDKLAYLSMEGFEEFEAEAADAMKWASGKVEEILTGKLGEEATVAAEKAEQARIKAEQEAEAARLKAEREELARQRAEAAAEAKRVADEARAQAEAAEAKVRAAAEEMAAQRAEIERMRAELEAKSKPAEQPVCAEQHQAAEPPAPEPAPVVVDPAPVVAQLPSAPVASAIVQAVAVYWDTDTKTAARWITERASEIETLKG